MSGITTEGFDAKPLEDCVAEMEADLREAFGAGVNLTPSSALAKIVGIVADRESQLWDLAEAVHLAFTPDGAAGTQLDNVMALTGAMRLAAERSTVAAVATGDTGTVLTAGRVVSVAGTGVRFATIEAATLEAVTAWGAATLALGVRRTNGGNVYQVTTAGTSVTGPTGTGTNIADGGTARWAYLGEGEAAADLSLEAEDTGAIPAAAATLTEIETPVAGWDGVTNLLDAELGRDVETDPAARVRREELLGVSGTSVVEAIRARVRLVDDVDAAVVFENTGLSTDGDGIPGKAIEALVLGGSADEIAQAIWNTKPGGIKAHGTTSGTALDAEGDAQTVAFTRPDELLVWVIVPVLDTDSELPADAVAQIKAALVALGAAQYDLGVDVVSSRLGAVPFNGVPTAVPSIPAIPGILDIGPVLIGLANPPTLSTTIAVTPRQIARLDTSRISVTGI